MTFHRSAAFRDEIESWVEDGIISPEQAARLRDRYDLDSSAAPPWYTRPGAILQGLAAFLVGMGLLLILSYNWHRFPVAVRSAIGLVPLAAAWVVGLRYAWREERERADGVLAFAGIAFGANIFLQAQIFHLTGYPSGGFMWWLIGWLPMALLLRSAVHTALLMAVAAIWMNLEIDAAHFPLWTVPIVGALAWLLIRRPTPMALVLGGYNLFLVLFLVDRALPPSLTTSDFVLLSVGAFLAIALLRLAPGEWPSRTTRVLQGMAIALLLFLGQAASFKGQLMGDSGTPAMVTGFAGLAGGFAAVLRGPRRPFDLLVAGSVAFLTVLALLSSAWDGHNGVAVFVAVMANLALLGLGVAAILAGLRDGDKRVFLGGVGLITLLAIVRYVELFEDYLVSATLFVLCGILIYGINIMWDRRYGT